MGFTVRGVLDGAIYEVQVGDGENPVTGNERVAALVKDWQGRTLEVTPQGPVLTVSSDPRGVLALLSAKTQVRKVGAGAPQLLPPPRRGTVD